MNILLQERRGSAVILTLNRPEKLNALSYALIDALGAALDELEGDRSVRAIAAEHPLAFEPGTSWSYSSSDSAPS